MIVHSFAYNVKVSNVFVPWTDLMSDKTRHRQNKLETKAHQSEQDTRSNKKSKHDTGCNKKSEHDTGSNQKKFILHVMYKKHTLYKKEFKIT